MASKNRSLSAKAFEKLLAWIDPAPEVAGEIYAETHRQLVVIFERAGCRPAEEFADEVMNRIARRLEIRTAENEIRTSEPVRFILGVARMIAHFEKIRHGTIGISIETLEPETLHAALQNAVDPAIEIENREETMRKISCAEKCLQELPTQDRVLIELYYLEVETPGALSHKNLAARYGLTESGLRTRVMRIRKRMQHCAQRCLQNRTN